MRFFYQRVAISSVGTVCLCAVLPCPSHCGEGKSILPKVCTSSGRGGARICKAYVFSWPLSSERAFAAYVTALSKGTCCFKPRMSSWYVQCAQKMRTAWMEAVWEGGPLRPSVHPGRATPLRHPIEHCARLGDATPIGYLMGLVRIKLEGFVLGMNMYCLT